MRPWFSSPIGPFSFSTCLTSFGRRRYHRLRVGLRQSPQISSNRHLFGTRRFCPMRRLAFRIVALDCVGQRRYHAASLGFGSTDLLGHSHGTRGLRHERRLESQWGQLFTRRRSVQLLARLGLLGWDRAGVGLSEFV